MEESSYILIAGLGLLVLQTFFALERPDVRSAWKKAHKSYCSSPKTAAHHDQDVYY